jgi:hypothetical protein
VYSIDELDRGTPTKAPNMMLKKSADSRHTWVLARTACWAIMAFL